MTEIKQTYENMKHPYENRNTTYSYIGSMPDWEGGEIHLYNTADGYTVSLETMLKNEPQPTILRNS